MTAEGNIVFSSSAWADYDNDGNIDVVWTGGILENGFDIPTSIAARNDGNGNFSCCPVRLNGVYGNAAWGDYDNDGNEDILIAGTNGLAHGAFTDLLRNHGDGAFEFIPIQASVPSVSRGSVGWGDFDGDGDLDVLLEGFIPSGGIVCRIYQNQGPGGFSLVEFPLAGVYDGSATFADYDNDGRLDVFCVGNSSNGPIARLYHNVGGSANSPPSAPGNLAVSVLGNTASFSWSPGADANQVGGQTFNIRVGTSPQAGDVVNPMAATNGFRRVVQIGNSDERHSRSITNLAPGLYYWSVQAVDNSFSGSPFAAEEAFIVKNVPRITSIQDQRTVVNVVTPEIPFMVSDVETPATSLALSATSSNTNLVPNQNILFGGTGSNRTVRVFPSTNEIGATTITVIVADADNASAGSSFVLRVDQFSELPLHLPGLLYSSVAWGDFDNDGELDLLVSGGSTDPADEPVVSRIHRNDGNGVFTDIKAGLQGVQLGTRSGATMITTAIWTCC
jgi:hypothetical protein